ncbi:hypothetical protein K7432_015518 [Basidiobolus ranarum]|uniref:PCI domain-containing protein n=1 Tax=Basidiobolus ranarum TaxID=34480 RepID=A0ABR2WG45_9FUNG
MSYPTVLETIQQVSQARGARDGELLAYYFDFDMNSYTDMLKKELQSVNNISALCRKNITERPYDDLTAAYLTFIKNVDPKNLTHLYDLFADIFAQFIPAFNAGDAGWLVPMVKKLSSYLVEFALQADKQTRVRSKNKKATDAARILSRTFNMIISDRAPFEESKKPAIYFVTNLAFKVYFNLNTIRLCQTFINNIQKAKLSVENFPISQQVTYRYYVGRLYLYQHLIKQAESELDFAFRRCPSEMRKNRKLIFLYLAIAKIIRGRPPTYELLAKYGYTEHLGELIRAIGKGDFQSFERCLETKLDWFLSTGNYMILKERCTILIYRHLIKRVFLMTHNPSPKSPPTLQYEDVLAAMKFATRDNDMDVNDAECILISLIDQVNLSLYQLHAPFETTNKPTGICQRLP